MKKSLVFILILLGIVNVKAQFLYTLNEDDALRFSQTGIGSTARSSAMAGAFGALGADFSSLSSNPAGIGLYKKSEFTFSPALNANKTISTFNDNKTTDYKYRFFFNNIGLVFNINSGNKPEEKGWQNIQIGFGINKLNSFNSQTKINGFSKLQFNNQTAYGTIMDAYFNDAYGKTPAQLNDFDTRLAYKLYLLDTSNGSTTINSLVPDYSRAEYDGAILQTKTITRTGALNEFDFSIGGNYSDKLYIGATLGIPMLHYNESTIYEENDYGDSIANFTNLKISDSKYIDATGLNLKVGAIYRATEWMRIGAALHTPSLFFNMNTNFTRKMESDNYTPAESPENIISNLMITPFKAIGNVGFVIGKLGLIDVDYEYVDYSMSSFSSSDYSFDDINKNITNNYRATSNVKVGGELNLSPFALRAGYAYYGNPNKAGLIDGKRTALTFGLGLKGKKVFADLAYVHMISNSQHYLYQIDYMQPAQIKNFNNTFVATFGVKF